MSLYREVWSDIWRFPWRAVWGFLKGIIPPHPDKLEQHINGVFRPIEAGDPVALDPTKYISLDQSPTGAYALRTAEQELVSSSISDSVIGNFHGEPYLLIMKSTTIKSEWNLLFAGEIFLEQLGTGSILYQSDLLTIRYDATGSVLLEGNGITPTDIGTIVVDKVNEFTIEISLDGVRGTFETVPFEVLAVSWVTEEASSLTIGASQVGSSLLEGFLRNIQMNYGEGDELFTLDDTLLGNRGTEATLINSTGIFFDFGLAYKYDINASGLISLVDHPTYTAQGTYLTQTELDAVYDPRLFYTAKTGFKYPRYLVYQIATELEEQEHIYAASYVGRLLEKVTHLGVPVTFGGIFVRHEKEN